MARKQKQRGEKDIDDMIKEALAEAPEVKGYTIKELAKSIDRPWPTTRWHLELLRARGEVTYREIGRAKLYSMIRKKAEKK